MWQWLKCTWNGTARGVKALCNSPQEVEQQWNVTFSFWQFAHYVMIPDPYQQFSHAGKPGDKAISIDFTRHRHHALTTFHSSFISWSAVMYSNTIATVTAEQRWLSSAAVYIVKVIGSTASAKVGIVVGNRTWVNKICIANYIVSYILGSIQSILWTKNYTYTCCLMQSRWQCENGEAQCRKWVTELIFVKKSPYNDSGLPFVFQAHEHVYKMCHSVAGVHACLLNLVYHFTTIQ